MSNNQCLISHETREILDKVTITQTVNKIGHMIDCGNWESLRHLISDEAVTWGWEVRTCLTLSDFHRLSHGTPEQFIEGLQSSYAWGFGLHLLTGHIIDLTGNIATCRCAFQLASIHSGVRDGFYIETGDMEHRLIRTSKGWRVNGYIVNFISDFSSVELIDIANQRGWQPKLNSLRSDPAR